MSLILLGCTPCTRRRGERCYPRNYTRAHEEHRSILQTLLTWPIPDTGRGLDRSHEAVKSLLVEVTIGARDTLPRFVHPSTSRKGYPEPDASTQNRKEGHMGGDTTT